MAGYLAPIFDLGAQFFTNQGVILAGGKIQVYAGGTTTPQDTWTDATLGVKNANPIILNSAGRLSTGVWLQSGLTYKFVLQDSTGATVGQPLDYVVGIDDPAVTSSQWVPMSATPTYVSSSSFTMPADQTGTLHVGRRIQATVTAGVVYGTILTSSFGGGTTTVTLTMDSTGLDSGLSLVNVAGLDSVNSPVPITVAMTTAMQRQSYTGFSTGGTATAYTLTPSPAITSNTVNTRFQVLFSLAAGATPTLAVSGLTALPLKFRNPAGTLTAITSAQVPSGWISDVETDGTNWIVLSVADPGSLSSTIVGTTQAVGDNSTKIATTAYADRAAFGANTWQDMSGSRTSGTVYTNSTGRAIQVLYSAYIQTSAFPGYQITAVMVVAGVTIANINYYTPMDDLTATISAIVPPGATYSITETAGLAYTSRIWAELR
jgi:hypothetical protein